ncbi:MAG: biotin synthase BioB [Planctomycetes bacterium]|nr:biotin synthase BioB [Planctomycetota bacterium]
MSPISSLEPANASGRSITAATVAGGPNPPTNPWDSLASRILGGERLAESEGLAILRSSEEELLELMAAAYRIRRQYWSNTVQFYFLMNAKSGLCPEDCSYCSQSKVSSAEIPRYNLLNRQQILNGARIAHERNAKTYCIVISARGPNEREMRAVEELVPEIKRQYPLDVCACLGLLSEEDARRLKACGVDTVNHNLNTSEDHYAQICSTHTYQDRIATLRAVREAGMKLCSGGIMGMGESDQDIVGMAFALRDLQVESIPVNFLNPIEGTPLAGIRALNPRRCLRILALYRFANPAAEIRIAGGRELHLGSMQCLGLYAANSLFLGDYLTTKGQAPEADYRMIEEMGFTVTREGPG